MSPRQNSRRWRRFQELCYCEALLALVLFTLASKSHNGFLGQKAREESCAMFNCQLQLVFAHVLFYAILVRMFVCKCAVRMLSGRLFSI